ncbi:PEP-CTERM sorting domain-containing protein [Haloferula rosea]|uniref:PEP-CTERM sorting domain-containing protein n=1 Tax=Haloferula rosea TaxID=490093 RepID=UPI002D803FD7|nr:PEP-CTERM sorting domain-containing protein [Haloferula rosea]
MNRSPLAMAAAASLCAAGTCLGATLYLEEFDGNTNDYNADSATATTSGDWVDFSNRMSSDSYTTASGGTETVLAGVSASNDPQVRSDFGFGIDKTIVTAFALRLRIDSDGNSSFDDSLTSADFSVFWGTSSYGTPGATNVADTNNSLGAPSSLVAQSDGWHLATWTIPSGGLTAGANSTIESLRIDPTNGSAGNGDSFEIDYFRIDGVPEPGSSTLVALGALTVCLRRRRQR